MKTADIFALLSDGSVPASLLTEAALGKVCQMLRHHGPGAEGAWCLP